MSFIRPEIAETASRWRETLSGIGLLTVALWLMSHGLGPRLWAGGLLAAFALGLILTGIPRARARLGGDGPGVVEVDEHRITYFGPVSGGAMALADIARIAAAPDKRWVLTSDEGERMTIPMDAAGSDDLFDIFAALPGMSGTKLADAMRRDVQTQTVVWEKPNTAVS